MMIAEAIKATEVLTTAVPFLSNEPTKHDYEEALDLVAELLVDYPTHPLVDILCARISDYEAKDPEIQAFAERMRAIPSDVGVLKTLINQHELTLSDLPEIGSKSMVSRVLSGERKMTIEHIRKLSARFDISPLLFV